MLAINEKTQGGSHAKRGEQKALAQRYHASQRDLVHVELRRDHILVQKRHIAVHHTQIRAARIDAVHHQPLRPAGKRGDEAKGHGQIVPSGDSVEAFCGDPNADNHQDWVESFLRHHLQNEGDAPKAAQDKDHQPVQEGVGSPGAQSFVHRMPNIQRGRKGVPDKRAERHEPAIHNNGGVGRKAVASALRGGEILETADEIDERERDGDRQVGSGLLELHQKVVPELGVGALQVEGVASRVEIRAANPAQEPANCSPAQHQNNAHRDPIRELRVGEEHVHEEEEGQEGEERLVEDFEDKAHADQRDADPGKPAEHCGLGEVVAQVGAVKEADEGDEAGDERVQEGHAEPRVGVHGVLHDGEHDEVEEGNQRGGGDAKGEGTDIVALLFSHQLASFPEVVRVSNQSDERGGGEDVGGNKLHVESNQLREGDCESEIHQRVHEEREKLRWLKNERGK
eukprot:Sdes_comp16042_c0_seq2m5249